MMSTSQDPFVSSINSDKAVLWSSNNIFGGMEEDISRSKEKPELHNLLKSAFAEPFYFQPSNLLGQQIFPCSWNDFEIPKCFSEVLTWADSTFKKSVEQCLNIVRSHVEFYKTDPGVTHDEKYTSDELVCLAGHLQIKLKKLLPKEAPEPVNRIFEKLKELFPTTDRTILLNKSRNHAQKHNDKEGELDLTKAIEDILSCSPR